MPLDDRDTARDGHDGVTADGPARAESGPAVVQSATPRDTSLGRSRHRGVLPP